MPSAGYLAYGILAVTFFVVFDLLNLSLSFSLNRPSHDCRGPMNRSCVAAQLAFGHFYSL